MASNSPDVVVMGGGIVGLSAACELARRGIRSLVLESGIVGRGATYAAGGILSPQAETRPDSPLLPLALQGRDRHVTLARELRDSTGIDVEHRECGVLSLFFDDAERVRAERLVAEQRRIGLRAETLSRSTAMEMEPAISPAAQGAAFFPDDHSVDNRRLIEALRLFATKLGVTIRENARIRRIEVLNGRVMALDLDGERVSADAFINTLGAWAGGIEGDPQPPPIRPVKGHMVALRGGPKVSRVVYGHHGYIVPRDDGRLIAGSTMEEAGFDAAVMPEGISKVRDIAAAIAPRSEDAHLEDAWIGFRPASPDGLPLIGKGGASNLIVAGGLFRNGILLGPLVGEIAAGLAAGETSREDLSAFAPDRFRN